MGVGLGTAIFAIFRNKSGNMFPNRLNLNFRVSEWCLKIPVFTLVVTNRKFWKGQSTAVQIKLSTADETEVNMKLYVFNVLCI